MYANGLITSRYNVILFFAILVVGYSSPRLELTSAAVRLPMPLVSQQLMHTRGHHMPSVRTLLTGICCTIVLTANVTGGWMLSRANRRRARTKKSESFDRSDSSPEARGCRMPLVPISRTLVEWIGFASVCTNIPSMRGISIFNSFT
jgi:hypothetical protein